MEKKETSAIFVQVIERPARGLILKRGKTATEYFAYCEELGCDIWGILTSIKDALYEPIGMWLPKKLRPEGTSEYAQGVEVPLDYAGGIPEGFEFITLEPCKMMIFQGEPYDDAYFETAILAVAGRHRPLRSHPLRLPVGRRGRPPLPARPRRVPGVYRRQTGPARPKNLTCVVSILRPRPALRLGEATRFIACGNFGR